MSESQFENMLVDNTGRTVKDEREQRQAWQEQNERQAALTKEQRDRQYLSRVKE